MSNKNTSNENVVDLKALTQGIKNKESVFKAVATIRNKLGLHARAAALFVQTASKFQSDILVKKVRGNVEVNGKSIMGVMMLAATYKSKILITAQGPDAQKALEELVYLVEEGLIKEEGE
jgi:phosphocarrier protein